jgi:glycosyltransferase involved in cell wall biosynthesis
MGKVAIALLGRRDEPTDALEEYCHYLRTALQPLGVQLDPVRVSSDRCGWANALKDLRRQAVDWRGTWVFVQYTALAWSARGFPHRIIRVLKILRSAGALVGVVFHDVEPYSGRRLVDAMRRAVQRHTMRWMVGAADHCFFTVPPEKLSWKPKTTQRVAFVPVGPNLPIPARLATNSGKNPVPCVGVFGVTGGEAGAWEIRQIVDSLCYATQKVGRLRLSVFGRNAELRKQDLEEGLHGFPVDLSVEGILDAPIVVERLLACDVMFFARGAISSRRGSAIAGIACGLPLIGISGSETAAPITEAGVILVEPESTEDLKTALARVLMDASFRNELAIRSRLAYETYFSWSIIASRFAAVIGK